MSQSCGDTTFHTTKSLFSPTWAAPWRPLKLVQVKALLEYIQKTKIKYKLNKKGQPVYILYNGEMFKISLLVEGHYIQHCNMGILG